MAFQNFFLLFSYIKILCNYGNFYLLFYSIKTFCTYIISFTYYFQ